MYHSTQIQDEPLGGTCLALSGLNILQRNNRNRNRNRKRGSEHRYYVIEVLYQ
jgi:hypothetical protein